MEKGLQGHADDESGEREHQYGAGATLAYRRAILAFLLEGMVASEQDSEGEGG